MVFNHFYITEKNYNLLFPHMVIHFYSLLSSVYGISEGTIRGIVVCNYPHGVFIGMCPGAPNIMNRAVPLFEKFVAVLRN